MNDVLEFLTNRRSIPLLASPPPSTDDLAKMFDAAIAAPDHGQLQPYRFIVFQGEKRHHLGELYASALRSSGVSESATIERAKTLPLRAPLVVAAILHAHLHHPKAPLEEQRITAGLATFQMISAASALGFGAYWRTGDIAYLPELARALGLATNESIIGFVYIGTPSGVPKPIQKKYASKEIWRMA